MYPSKQPYNAGQNRASAMTREPASAQTPSSRPVPCCPYSPRPALPHEIPIQAPRNPSRAAIQNKRWPTSRRDSQSSPYSRSLNWLTEEKSSRRSEQPMVNQRIDNGSFGWQRGGSLTQSDRGKRKENSG